MDHHAADHHRHHRVGRNAEGEHGDVAGLGGGVVRTFGCCHALDHAGAEFLRGLGDAFLQRVCGKTRQHRAAARQDAEHAAQRSAAQHRRERLLEVLARRHQPADLGTQQIAALLVGQVGHDLVQAEHPHGNRHEVDAVEQDVDAEGVAQCAGVHVRADNAEQQAEQDHADRLDH